MPRSDTGTMHFIQYNRQYTVGTISAESTVPGLQRVPFRRGITRPNNALMHVSDVGTEVRGLSLFLSGSR